MSQVKGGRRSKALLQSTVTRTEEPYSVSMYMSGSATCVALFRFP